MYLFPAIDIRDGQVVRLYRGDYEQQTTYGQDPLAQAMEFAEAGATWVHVVDLDGARQGRVLHLGLIERICRETPLRVEVGGGIRTEGAIDALLRMGVQRVVLGTAALQNWDWFEGLMANPAYRGRLVLGLDARKGKLAVSGWEQQVEATPFEVAQRVSDWPVAGIVYTDIQTDGTLSGPNVESTREVADATGAPVVASGGVGTLEHLEQLRELPIHGVIVGRAIYDQAFSVADAIAVLEKGRPVTP